MRLSKYDSANIKILNKKIILRVIHKHKPISRKEISKLTGLKGSSVTRLVSELMEDGHVVEVGVLNTGAPGRRERLLQANPEYKVSFLLDIGVHDTSLAVGFYDGTLKLVDTFRTPHKVENFFDTVKNYYRKLSKLYTFSTVVLSVPGMVDIDSKTILTAPNLGWKDIPILKYLELDVPILADNEANLSVLAEKYHSKLLGKFTDVVFVIIREGVGTGVMVGNNLLRGKFFSAGEFGHMTIDIDSGKRCHCGKTGCWELYASMRYAISRAKKELQDFKGESFEELTKRSDAVHILKDMARNIGKGLVNIVNALNPEVIVLGGVVANMPPYFFREILNVVRAEALRPANRKVIILPTMFKDVSSNLVGANIYAIEFWIENLEGKHSKIHALNF